MSTMRIRNARVFNSYTQTFEEKACADPRRTVQQLQETKEEQCCPCGSGKSTPGGAG